MENFFEENFGRATKSIPAFVGSPTAANVGLSGPSTADVGLSGTSTDDVGLLGPLTADIKLSDCLSC